MKKANKLLSLVIVWTLLLSSTNLLNANTTDNQLEEAVSEKDTKTTDLKKDFKLHKFNSCSNMQDVLWDYLKEYYKNNEYDRPIYYNDDLPMELRFEAPTMAKSINAVSVSSADWIWWGWTSITFSETNVQIKWVDESDIIKTDWKYSYYFSQEDNSIYIIDSFPAWDLEVKKKIKIPNKLYSPVLYVHNNKLVILSQVSRKNSKTLNYASKTSVAVYDVSNIDSISLDKYYEIEWRIKDSRRIWDNVYIISNKYVNFPYYRYNSKITLDSFVDEQVKNLELPKIIEIRKTSNASDQNVEYKWKKYPYNLNIWSTNKCNEISYVLPESDKLDIRPSFTIISVLSLTDSRAPTTTDVIFWNTNNVFMSWKNLYVTSSLYLNNRYSCWSNMRCIMPFFNQWANTIIHKLNIDNKNISYQESTIINWSPLTQYSMNENSKWWFEILTQIRWEESYVDLNILDKDLEPVWKLSKIWLWEEFKSSRYIWDKLFLVTFERTDPLFVIDTKDKSNPKIIWELKIPGYSTYLHPLDDNHLIGLGYDTYENEWGWINTWGIKVDLYKIDYNKKDEAWLVSVTQEDSFVIWDKWSSSEALSNPRMFMWYKEKNLLFLPIKASYTLSKNSWKNVAAFQWLVSLKITPEDWIKKETTLTHINKSEVTKDRDVECKKYESDIPKVWECKVTIDWREICYNDKDIEKYEKPEYRYVPKYCNKDPEWKYTISWDKYFADNIYKWNHNYINRALYINDTLYSFSNNKVSANNIENNYSEIKSINLD